MSKMSSFFCGLALSVSLFALLASPARAESAGDPCQEPTVGRVYSVEGPNGPSLVCNGTTLDVYESVTGGPTRKGIATASPKTTLDVGGEIRVNTTGIGCDADREGALRYYSAGGTPWEYCNGSAWVPFESAGLSGPAGCADIGDLCADGTVFAGWHPITNEHLFIPTTNQGFIPTWKTSTGTNDITTDSLWDGRVNSNQVPNSTTFPAFKLCKDLGTGGYSDWYLPSRIELYYLWSVHETIEAAGNITNFHNDPYWSSTEQDISNAWYQYLSDEGSQYYTTKTITTRVRCVRR